MNPCVATRYVEKSQMEAENRESGGCSDKKFYRTLANLLKSLDTKTCSLKTAVYNSRKVAVGRSYAILSDLLKCQSVVDHVIASTPLGRERCEPFILKVLVHQLIFCGREIHGSSRTVLLVRKYERELRDARRKHLKASGCDSREKSVAKGTPQLRLPRYARVNTLLTTTESVIQTLLKDGFTEVTYGADESYEQFIEHVKQLEHDQFLRDFHIEDLLVFHPQRNFSANPLYTNCHIILQDKSSCFVVPMLAPRPGATVMDACAAPGMKTTHLAALMGNEGALLANDLSVTRVAEMKNILRQAGVSCAVVTVADFLMINPQKAPYSNTQFILLDTACSCSGMVHDRQLTNDYRAPQDEAMSVRLRKLSALQLKMLRHALSFPGVERVAYSTCSIHCEENEGVVLEALRNFQATFVLSPPPVGCPVARYADGVYRPLDRRCLKTVAERDLVNGFFAAVFQRKMARERV